MERIEQRIKDNEEYEKQRASRRRSRGRDLSELISNASIGNDMASLYNEILSQINTEYISREIEPTEE
jgi:predicted Zn-dependent peptidase